MAEKPFDPNIPSPENLAGVGFEMGGVIDRTVKPASPEILAALKWSADDASAKKEDEIDLDMG